MEPQVGLKEPLYFYPSCPGSGRVLRWLRGRGCFPKVSSIGPQPWWVFITLPAPSECSSGSLLGHQHRDAMWSFPIILLAWPASDILSKVSSESKSQAGQSLLDRTDSSELRSHCPLVVNYWKCRSVPRSALHTNPLFQQGTYRDCMVSLSQMRTQGFRGFAMPSDPKHKLQGPILPLCSSKPDILAFIKPSKQTCWGKVEKTVLTGLPWA